MSSSPSDKPKTPEPESKPTTDVPKIVETEYPNEESTPEPEPTTDVPKIVETENPNEESTDPSLIEKENESQDGNEEGECGFCLFMKGGECRETFINWEKCVEEGEKNGEDIVNKCFEATSALKICMEAHPDYYGVILQAEKDAEQEVSNQLDQEKAQIAAALDSGKQQQEQESH